MFQKNQVKIQEERQEKETTRKTLLQNCQALFDEVVNADCDEIGRDDLMVMLPRIHGIFESLNMPYTFHDLQDMLDVMDTDGSGAVNKAEFCRGLLHVAENSEDLRPMLMMELHCDSMQFLKTKLTAFELQMFEAVQEQRDDRMIIDTEFD